MHPPQRTIYALEGGVCSGKSTVAAQLAGGGDTLSLPDYSTFISERDYAAAALLPAAERFRYFVDLDRLRTRSLPADASRAVLDRSIFTVLAYEYVMLRTGRIDGLDHVTAELERGLVTVPSVAFFLDTPMPVRLQRHAQRATPVDPILLDDGFNAQLRSFFEFAARYGPVLFIETERASPTEIAARCRASLAIETRSWGGIPDLIALMGSI